MQKNFNFGFTWRSKSLCFPSLFVVWPSYGKLSTFGVHIVFLKALFVEWLTGWKNTSYVSVKKMGCLHWLRLGDSQQWSGVDMPVCWWKFRVLTSGGDGPSPGAEQQRVDSVGWARAHIIGTVASGSLWRWSGVKRRVRIHASVVEGPGHSAWWTDLWC